MLEYTIIVIDKMELVNWTIYSTDRYDYGTIFYLENVYFYFTH